MEKMINFSNIRNITVSGRIGAGATTLAKSLAQILNWQLLEGGELFRQIHKDLKLKEEEADLRPDKYDLEYEEKIIKKLKEDSHIVLQSHLAGFDAQGIEGIFKILVLCEDKHGEDKTDIRIDRLINRDNISAEEAKKEIKEREINNLKKWRKLYALNNQNWTYLDRKYYDLVINTFDHNKEEALRVALDAIGHNK